MTTSLYVHSSAARAAQVLPLLAGLPLASDARISDCLATLTAYAAGQNVVGALITDYERCRAAVRDAEINEGYYVEGLTTSASERKATRLLAEVVETATRFALGPLSAPSWAHVVVQHNTDTMDELSELLDELQTA
ncbi:hypothetical protein K3G63_10875 [Hymenobacter sp. HSC-4F20]|uniref:hypothetical protein n=1 Tax=Hymenobacter sp. HSC-4F20 TaxID=2864135 RepID=UPI001C737A48|nr:hypothetical protein [Hymenobacter sp. HSC-4F20]MBX0290945.1 hypothetical protein [Hymenobacter sp. HSC-4F20]